MNYDTTKIFEIFRDLVKELLVCRSHDSAVGIVTVYGLDD
jgi:hypothetical protein